MTEISEAAWRKAAELFQDEFDAVVGTDSIDRCKLRALARVLQEHSDVAKEAHDLDVFGREQVRRHLAPLFLPDEPDPLDGLLEEAGRQSYGTWPQFGRHLRKLLDAAGYKIVKVEDVT